MTTNRLTIATVSLMVIAAITVVVALALGLNRLGDLIGGVFAVGAIVVALAAIGVNLYSRMSASRAQREELLFHHAEIMAKQGVMIDDRRALNYRPIPQLPAPDDSDIPISTAGITNSTVDQYFEDALNLAALSAQWHRENHQQNPKQLAPWRVAKLNDYFRGGEGLIKWQHGMAYFCLKLLAMEQKVGGKSRGTFLNASTPEQIFQVMQSSPHPNNFDVTAKTSNVLNH